MNHSTNKGFTIIEVTIAMTFVATLLVTIALLTIQITHIYTKGITLKEVNTAGQSIGDDFQTIIGQNSPVPLTSSNYISTSAGGRLCLGSYTYAWNTGPALAGTGGLSPLNTYGAGSTTKINLVRVSDTGTLCVSTHGAYPNIPTGATELLPGGDRQLAVQSLAVSESSPSGTANVSQALYYIDLVIGTNSDPSELISGGTSCKQPSTSDGNQDYCSVNEFDFVIRAGNTAGNG